MTDIGNSPAEEQANTGREESAGTSSERNENGTHENGSQQSTHEETTTIAPGNATAPENSALNETSAGSSTSEATAAPENAMSGKGSTESTNEGGDHAAQPAGTEQFTDVPAASTDDASGDTSPATDSPGGDQQGAPKKGPGRQWRPPRLAKEEMREIWQELQAKKEAGESVELEVVGHNRGGVVAQYRGVEVFLPMSHWSLERNASGEPTDIRAGSTTQANILEITDFDTDARRVTATRRGTLRKDRLVGFQPGQRITGKVSSIHDFGIFVDLGGIDGLVHASEMSHVRGKSPGEMVKLGDEVEVVVKEIDPQKERIYLGMKQLGPSPWDNADEKYPEDSIQNGKVVGFSKNGAFVELEPGIEGFIRMRELSFTKRVQRPRDILKKGAEVQVKVLEIAGAKQRLSLSYRQAQENPWPSLVEKYAVGTSWKGNITEISNKGIVVDIGEIEGFLPRGRMGQEAKRLPDMKVGEEIEVNVLEIDAERHSLIFAIPGQEQSRFEGGGAGGERGPRPERPRGDRPPGSGGQGSPGGGPRSSGGGGPRPFGSDRPQGGRGGERGGERSGGGERRGGGRDRNQPTAPPAKAVDEIKGAELAGSFSLGDLLGDAIKKQLGVKEQEQPKPVPKPASPKPEAVQASTPATEQATTAGESEQHPVTSTEAPAESSSQGEQNTEAAPETPAIEVQPAEQPQEAAQEGRGQGPDEGAPESAPEGFSPDTPA